MKVLSSVTLQTVPPNDVQRAMDRKQWRSIIDDFAKRGLKGLGHSPHAAYLNGKKLQADYEGNHSTWTCSDCNKSFQFTWRNRTQNIRMRMNETGGEHASFPQMMACADLDSDSSDSDSSKSSKPSRQGKKSRKDATKKVLAVYDDNEV